MIKTFKAIIWTAAFAAAIYGIIYAFWLVLYFMLFEDPKLWLAAVAELACWGFYFWLLKIL